MPLNSLGTEDAPYWDSEAKGAIVGITRGTTREDVVRAALDSIAYQVRDVIVAMESDTGHRISELRSNGRLLVDAINQLQEHTRRPRNGNDRRKSPTQTGREKRG